LMSGCFQVQIECDLSQSAASELVACLASMRVIAEVETRGEEAERHLVHPGLGVHRQAIDSMGEPVLRVSQVASILARSGGNLAEFERLMRLSTGQAWLDLVDPLRISLEGVTYLPRAV